MWQRKEVQEVLRTVNEFKHWVDDASLIASI